MTPKRKRVIIGASIIAGLFVILVLWQYRFDVIRRFERASLPEAVEYNQVQNSLPTASSVVIPPEQPIATRAPAIANNSPTGLPAEVNLAIPFTPQAPHANWALPYKEFCEEASVLMVSQYLQGQSIPNADFAEQQMLAIKDFEDRYFGYYKDTTAQETATILTEYLGVENVQVVPNPTVLQMKEALAAGKPVIVPAAGRLLGNPYYQNPGPLYHMFVIKGYTADGKFIVNDPGTRRGADFVYSEDTIMNAMHDWRTDEQIEKGQKVVIIVG